MPFIVCKTSTHHTRTKNGTCQAKGKHENPTSIARQDGLLQLLLAPSEDGFMNYGD